MEVNSGAAEDTERGGGGYWEVVSDVFLVNFQPFVLNSRSAILLKGRKWHFICESQLSVMI